VPPLRREINSAFLLVGVLHRSYALNRAPHAPLLRRHLAAVYEKLEKWTELEQTYNVLLRLDGSSLTTHLDLVLMHITKQGRWRKAQDHLRDLKVPKMLAEGGERGRKCLVLSGYLMLLDGSPACTQEARFLIQVRGCGAARPPSRNERIEDLSLRTPTKDFLQPCGRVCTRDVEQRWGHGAFGVYRRRWGRR
jgi:hypothetical protein